MVNGMVIHHVMMVIHSVMELVPPMLVRVIVAQVKVLQAVLMSEVVRKEKELFMHVHIVTQVMN